MMRQLVLIKKEKKNMSLRGERQLETAANTP